MEVGITKDDSTGYRALVQVVSRLESATSWAAGRIDPRTWRVSLAWRSGRSRLQNTEEELEKFRRSARSPSRAMTRNHEQRCADPSGKLVRYRLSHDRGVIFEVDPTAVLAHSARFCYLLLSNQPDEDIIMARNEYINVKDGLRGARGNGIKDDTDAFRRALQKAGEQAHGGVVFAPAGSYRIEGTLVIPSNVTLEGVFRAPPMVKHGPVERGDPKMGTTLLACPSKPVTPPGDSEPLTSDADPFITLEGPSSTLKGIAIHYPEQRPPVNASDEIVPYPWTIQDDKGSNNAIIDVLLINSYKGVNFSRGSKRHLIQRLCGQPLRCGILVDRCSDLGRIEDVHFWPFWIPWGDASGQRPEIGNPHIRKFIAGKGVALVLRKSDWQIVDNFFAFGYRTGVRFEASEEPPEKGSPYPNGQFSNLNLDSVGVGLDVCALKSQGVQVSNANIALGQWANIEDIYRQDERCAVWGRPELETGALSIRGAAFWGHFDEVIRWESEEGSLLVASSVFDNWKKDHSAIRINKGRATVQGNIFPTNKIGRSITVENGAKAVAIMGNQLGGNPIEIQKEDRSAVVEANNLPAHSA